MVPGVPAGSLTVIREADTQFSPEMPSDRSGHPMATTNIVAALDPATALPREVHDIECVVADDVPKKAPTAKLSSLPRRCWSWVGEATAFCTAA